MLHDLRFALRVVARSPGFTAVAVLILGLGIGANTTIFSLVSALMLRPIPGVADPGSLVMVRGTPGDLSYPDLVDFRTGARSLAQLAGVKPWAMDVRVGDETRRVRGALVSSNYFAVLGVTPALGRVFVEEEEAGTPGGHPVVVLGYALWRERLGADPGVVGRTIGINGRPFTIIGVAPEGFRGAALLEADELWVPLAMFHEVAPGLLASTRERWPRWLTAIGRLAPGYRTDQANAEIRVIAERLERIYPDRRGQSAEAIGLRAEERGMVAPYLGLLAAIVGAVLLIACANVASLLLARGSGRRREIAIRGALGAVRQRIVRQLLVESLVLSAAGAAVGLLLTLWTTRALALWLRAHLDGFPTWLSLAPDARVLGVTIGLTVVTSLLFGLAPAHQLSTTDLVSGLKDGVADSAPSKTRLRQLLVAFQVAASLILTIATADLVTTTRRLLNALPAAAPEQVLQGQIEPALEGYDFTRATIFYTRLLERLRVLPGVASAALARNRLPWDRSFFGERVVAQGRAGPDSLTDVRYEVISPDYFRTMGLGLLRGRDVTDQDVDAATHVVVVNETVARRLWPGEDPVGKHLRLWSDDDREVIGLARDRAWRGQPAPFIYLPFTQRNPWPANPMVLNVRVAGPAASLAPALRREVAALDPNVPVIGVGTLAVAARDDLVDETLASLVMGAAGLFALLLAAVGVYGVMAYAVARRTHEFGVRMALGASRGDVLAQVLREGMLVTAAGLVAGVPAALLLTRVILRTLLGAGVATADPATVLISCLVLALAGLLACIVPARRAVRVEPMEALRCE